MPSQLSVINSYESNPYPTNSTQDMDMASLLLTLREQHNLSQAGDSTFPWELLTQNTDDRLYTPGSCGRFVHDTYGMIGAVYVQYHKPQVGVWSGAPIGFAKTNRPFSWMATNDIGISRRADVIGLQAGYTTPTTGQYGWVITRGINIQSIECVGQTKPQVHDSVYWFANGTITNATVGKQIGTVVSTIGMIEISPTQWEIPPCNIRLGAS
jgi:hypothetical protein